MPPAARKPQDHLPTKGTLFKFVGADGKTYTLPLASDGVAEMTGGEMEDAIMDTSGVGELKLAFSMLRACGASDAARQGLRGLKNEASLKVLGDWMAHGDGEGASIPQSSGSST